MFLNQKISCLCSVVLLACAGLRGLRADSVTPYTNDAAWQAAATGGGVNPLATVSFEASAWTQTVSYGTSQMIVTDTTTASNGVSVILSNAANVEASYPIFSNNSVTINETGFDPYYLGFGQNLYAFGAYFSVPACHPDRADPCLVSYLFGEPVIDGFLGFTSTEPIGIPLSPMCSPFAPSCGGELITISDLQLSTTALLPSPEPGGLGLGTITTLSFLVLRLYKNRQLRARGRAHLV